MPTLDTLRFYSWWRDAVHGGSTAVSGPRLTTSVELTLEQRSADGAVQATESGTLTVKLAGPLDVTSLAPEAVTRRYPARDATAAEETKFVHLELADHRLPWRYTPAATPGAAEPLAPWLVLVVGAPDTEVSLTDDRVALSGDVLRAHDLATSHLWAHVQEAGDRRVARIVSPRPLEPRTSYVAVLVPAFTEGAAGVEPAWVAETDNVELPAFTSWRFRTGDDGDFLSLTRALTPRSISAADAAVEVAYPRVPDVDTFATRGALAAPASADAPLPPAVESDLEAMVLPDRDGLGRPIVGLPRYGRPWVASPAATPWSRELNHDPRHRIAAGLGRRFAADAQQRLTDAAVESLGALSVAEQRVRFLALGIDAARSLWRRRLPAGAEAQLQLFGPALARLMTPRGLALDRATAVDRPLPAALFSSAARRVLRGGPARSRSLADGSLTPSRVLCAANRCPTPPSPAKGLPHLGHPQLGQADTNATLRSLAKGERHDIEGTVAATLRNIAPVRDPEEVKLVAAWTAAHLDDECLPLGLLLWLVAVAQLEEEQGGRRDDIWRRLFKVVRGCFRAHEDDPKVAELLECLRKNGWESGDRAYGLDALEQLVATLRPPRERPCRPVDLNVLADGVRRAFDPTVEIPRAAERVYDGLDGIDRDPAMAPVEACPSVDLPIWELLRAHGPEWLLPGIGQLDEHAVAAVETNPVFVEALLVGANQQLVDELAWRAIPIGRGCTPLRHFWGRRAAETGTRVPDIRGVGSWPRDSRLASPAHRHDPAAGADLVVLFRSPLFHRYPETAVYLHPASPDWSAPPAEGRPVAQDVHPTFQGRLGEDIAFFGFTGLTATDAARMWLILEEPPSGYSFREPTGVAPDVSAAARARATLAPPVRVVIRGDSLLATT